MVDYAKVEDLLDVVEAVQRVHIPFLIPIQQLALKELEPLAAEAKTQLDAMLKAEAEAEAQEREKLRKESEEVQRREEEANQAGRPGGQRMPPMPTPPPGIERRQ